MGKYTEISELVIKVLNEYTSIHKKQLIFSGENRLSFSEAQVIEEILKHQNPNMTKLSMGLGVTKAAITKTMKKLETKKYISRFKLLSNNKDILASVTTLGMDIYKEYQNYIFDNLFKEIYQMFDERDGEYVHDFKKFFKSVDKSLHKISEDKL